MPETTITNPSIILVNTVVNVKGDDCALIILALLILVLILALLISLILLYRKLEDILEYLDSIDRYLDRAVHLETKKIRKREKKEKKQNPHANNNRNMTNSPLGKERVEEAESRSKKMKGKKAWSVPSEMITLEPIPAPEMNDVPPENSELTPEFD